MTDDQRDLLESELRSLATERDPVPEEVLASAFGAFALRSLDAELAELTYDSLLDESLLAGVRGSGATRHLTFEASDCVLDVQVDVAGERRLEGQITPPGPTELEVHHSGGTTRAPVTRLGRFVVSPAPRGPFSIRLPSHAERPSLSTMWIAL